MLNTARLLGKIATVVSLCLMLILCLPIAYEAVARFFNAPTIWVYETSMYGFIFLGFLGNALAVRTGAHFRVTLLCEVFPSWSRFFDRVAQVFTLIFAVLIIASGVYFMGYSISNEIVSATLLEIPLWIPQIAIPLGGLGLFLGTLVQMITNEEPLQIHGVGE